MKGICVLGATGSIGVSTLDVIARHPDEYRVIALTANKNVDRLLEQCIAHQPDYAVIVDHTAVDDFKKRLAVTAAKNTKVLSGRDALSEVATLSEVDSVMAAIVGAAGLMPTLAAARCGKTVLLANKEALVMSGPLFMNEVERSGACLLPIDSEHNAIFQCMPAGYQAGERAASVRRILLTASGGPFRTTPIDQLPDVTPSQAVAHPNWVMGQKISVDSATMMNKGLELIEACLLFDMSAQDVQVVIHPQSVIHSMVDYTDGTVLAQLGNPDMRIPIAHALAWPKRFESGAEPLNIFDVQRMDFEPPDEERFPCLSLAIKAASLGGLMPTVLNASNEVAVEAFLSEKIRYTQIAEIIAETLEMTVDSQVESLEQVLEIDRLARATAYQHIRRFS